MTNLLPPKKNNKGVPPSLAETKIVNTAVTHTDKGIQEVPVKNMKLALSCTKERRKEIKQYAIEHDTTINDVLDAAFDYYKLHHP